MKQKILKNAINWSINVTKNVCGKRCKISEQKKCFSNRQYLVSSMKEKFFNDKSKLLQNQENCLKQWIAKKYENSSTNFMRLSNKQLNVPQKRQCMNYLIKFYKNILPSDLFEILLRTFPATQQHKVKHIRYSVMFGLSRTRKTYIYKIEIRDICQTLFSQKVADTSN